MSKKTTNLEKVAIKAIQASQYLLGVLSYQEDLFNVKLYNFLFNQQKKVFNLTNKQIDKYLEILIANGALKLLPDEVELNTLMVNHRALASLILNSVKISNQNPYLQLPCIERIISDEFVEKNVRNFYQDYQCFNLWKYEINQLWIYAEREKPIYLK